MPSTREDRKRRIEIGQCLWCSSKCRSDSRFCQSCIDKKKERGARYFAVGLCYCGRPRIENRHRCENCLASLATASKSRRKQNQNNGLCFCGNKSRQGRATCVDCAERSKKSARIRHEAGLCRCGRAPAMDGKKTCSICVKYKADLTREIRNQALRGYGGKCICCGEKDFNVLELDHVNGDGKSHRQELRNAFKIFQWAIENGFPERLQLLCANCHMAKTRTGDCSYRAQKA